MKLKNYKRIMIIAMILNLSLPVVVKASDVDNNVIAINLNLKEKIEKQLEEIELKRQKELQKQKDIDLLARVINAEMGCSWFSDDLLKYTGSVVLNRIKDNNFPNSLYDVIYAKGQYKCTWDGNIEKEPAERHYKIAKELIENGSVLPDSVVYQAEFPQGSGIYYQYYDEILDTTIYFCYK